MAKTRTTHLKKPPEYYKSSGRLKPQETGCGRSGNLYPADDKFITTNVLEATCKQCIRSELGMRSLTKLVKQGAKAQEILKRASKNKSQSLDHQPLKRKLVAFVDPD